MEHIRSFRAGATTVDPTPDLRMVVALPRSGSTMTMCVLAEHPDVGVTSRLTLMGKMGKRTSPRGTPRDFEPDHSVFNGPWADNAHPIYANAMAQQHKVVISKEEVGNDLATGTPELNECNFPVFPDDDAIRQTKPVFLIREPKAAFDSWLAKGWDDIDAFITAYRNVARMYDHAKSVVPGTPIVTYDMMVESRDNQQMVFEGMCKHWDMPFDPKMLNYDNESFGEKFVYANPRERDIYVHQNPKGLFTTVKQHNEIKASVPGHGKLSAEQAQKLDDELGDLFQRLDSECRLQAYRQRRASAEPIRALPQKQTATARAALDLRPA